MLDTRRKSRVSIISGIVVVALMITALAFSHIFVNTKKEKVDESLAETGNFGDFTVSYSGAAPSFDEGTEILTLAGGGTYSIDNTSVATSGHRIHINGGSVTLNVSNLSIEGAVTPMMVLNGTNVTLNLQGSMSVVESGGWSAGINVLSNSTLTINGPGNLYARGTARAAAIGGGENEGSGNITINSGYITAENGAWHGTGIGSGQNGGSFNLRVNGGTINCPSWSDGGGIGDGFGAQQGNATIDGGSFISPLNIDSERIKNSNNKKVKRNALTVGDPHVGEVTIDNMKVDDVSAAQTPNPASGIYGIRDAKTSSEGRFNVYLPKSKTMPTGEKSTVQVTVGGKIYSSAYNRADANDVDTGSATYIRTLLSQHIDVSAVNLDSLRVGEPLSNAYLSYQLRDGAYGTIYPNDFPVGDLPPGLDKYSVTKISSTEVRVIITGSAASPNAASTRLSLGSTIASRNISGGFSHNPQIMNYVFVGPIIGSPQISQSLTGLTNLQVGKDARNSYVTLSLSEGVFKSTINQTYTISNLPEGLVVGSITRVNDTQIRLNITGAPESVYPTGRDINVNTVGPGDIVDYGGYIVPTGTMQIGGIAAAPTISVSVSGLDSLQVGKTVSAQAIFTLSGGTWKSPITGTDFKINNLPSGISYGTAVRVNDTTVRLPITGVPNATTGGPTNLTADALPPPNVDGISISITPTGTIQAGQVTAGASIVASISGPSSLQVGRTVESTYVQFTLTNGTYVAVGSLHIEDFNISNLPDGLSKGTLQRVNSTTVRISIVGHPTQTSGQRTLTIGPVAARNIQGNGAAISPTGSPKTAAVTAAPTITASIQGLDALQAKRTVTNAAIIYTIADGEFDSGFTGSHFLTNSLPDGFTRGTLEKIGNNQIKVNIEGAPNAAGPAVQIGISSSISAEDMIGMGMAINVGGGPLYTSSITAAPSIAVSATGLGDLKVGTPVAGAYVSYTLTGAKWTGGPTAVNFNVTGLPAGLSVGAVSIYTDNIIMVSITGTPTTANPSPKPLGYSSPIPASFIEGIGSSIAATGSIQAGPVAQVGNITVAVSGLNNLQVGRTVTNASVTYSLAGATYATINPSHFDLTGIPSGLSATDASKVNDTLVKITISGTPTTVNTDSQTLTHLNLIPASNVTGASSPVTASGIISAGPVASKPAIAAVLSGLDNLQVGRAVTNASITYTLSRADYETSIVSSDFNIYGLPNGLVAGTATKTGDKVVKIIISGTPDGTGSTSISYPSQIPAANISGIGIPIDVVGDLGSGGVGTPGGTGNGPIDVKPSAPAPSITASISGLGNLQVGRTVTNGSISFTLSGGAFNDTINTSDFNISGIPAGLSVGNATKVNDKLVKITIGNHPTVANPSAANITIPSSIAKANVLGMGENVAVSGTLGVGAVAKAPYVLVGAIGLSNLQVGRTLTNGALIYTLNNAEYDSISTGDFVVSGLPIGLSQGNAVKISQNMVKVSITGTPTTDNISPTNITYPSQILAGNILGIAIDVNAYGDPSTGGSGGSGGDGGSGNPGDPIVVSPVAISPTVSITAAGLATLQIGQPVFGTVHYILSGASFANTAITPLDFYVNNLPAGLSTSGIARYSDTVVAVSITGTPTAVNASQVLLGHAPNVLAKYIEGIDQSIAVNGDIYAGPVKLEPAISVLASGLNALQVGRTVTNASITFSLVGATFDSIVATNFAITGIPSGLNATDASKINDTLVKITITGTPNTVNASTQSLTYLNLLPAGNFSGFSDKVTATGILAASAVASKPAISVGVSGLDALQVGRVVTNASIIYTLTGAAYEGSIEADDFALLDLPAGLVASAPNRLNDHMVKITITGTPSAGTTTVTAISYPTKILARNILGIDIDIDAKGDASTSIGGGSGGGSGGDGGEDGKIEVKPIEALPSITTTISGLNSLQVGRIVTNAAISFKLSGAAFENIINTDDFEVLGLPDGLSAALATREGDKLVKIIISGTPTVANENSTGLTYTSSILARNIIGIGEDISPTGSLEAGAVATAPYVLVGAANLDSLQVGRELTNGSITFTLIDASYEDIINEQDFSISGLPNGLSTGTAVKISQNMVKISITGTPLAANSGPTTISYVDRILARNIIGIGIDVAAYGDPAAGGSGGNGGSGNPGDGDLGNPGDPIVVNPVAEAPTVEVSTVGLDNLQVGRTLRSAYVLYNLQGANFTGALSPLDFTAEGLPDGLSVGSVEQVSSNAVGVQVLGVPTTSDEHTTALTFSAIIPASNIEGVELDALATGTPAAGSVEIEPRITVRTEGLASLQVGKAVSNGFVVFELADANYENQLANDHFAIGNLPPGLKLGNVQRAHGKAIKVAIIGTPTTAKPSETTLSYHATIGAINLEDIEIDITPTGTIKAGKVAPKSDTGGNGGDGNNGGTGGGNNGNNGGNGDGNNNGNGDGNNNGNGDGNNNGNNGGNGNGGDSIGGSGEYGSGSGNGSGTSKLPDPLGDAGMSLGDFIKDIGRGLDHTLGLPISSILSGLLGGLAMLAGLPFVKAFLDWLGGLPFMHALLGLLGQIANWFAGLSTTGQVLVLAAALGAVAGLWWLLFVAFAKKRKSEEESAGFAMA